MIGGYFIADRVRPVARQRRTGERVEHTAHRYILADVGK